MPSASCEIFADYEVVPVQFTLGMTMSLRSTGITLFHHYYGLLPVRLKEAFPTPKALWVKHNLALLTFPRSAQTSFP